MDKILYTPEEVHDLIGEKNVVVIDVRDPLIYDAGHIPGAFNIHEVFSYLSKSSIEELNKLRKYFHQKFCRVGVSEEKKVVFYAHNLTQNLGASCRGYWILSYLGHKNAGILDGGLANWVSKGLPVTTQKTELPMKSNFKLNIQDNIIADKNFMLSAINNSQIKIIDNRDKPEWVGSEISPYGEKYILPKGRIPGAVWIEWYNFLKTKKNISYFKSPEQILKICERKGINREKEVIIYCFKGARASSTYVALKLAGFNKVRNYFASWYEWAELKDVPIEELKDVPE